ncbi:MAG: hypothetical protein V4660_17910 [Pseudomonadota bacterium]
MKTYSVYLAAGASILSALALALFAWEIYINGSVEWKFGMLPFIVFIGSTTQFFKLRH